MDKVYDAVLNKLSGPSSRRGFLSSLGKLALAGGAIAAGLGTQAAMADCGCCPNGCGGCINPQPENLFCTPGNTQCCHVSGTGYYSYTPCTGCVTINGQIYCCSGSQSCAGPLGSCGGVKVYRG